MTGPKLQDRKYTDLRDEHNMCGWYMESGEEEEGVHGKVTERCRDKTA